MKRACLSISVVGVSFFPPLAQGCYKEETMAMELAETAQRFEHYHNVFG